MLRELLRPLNFVFFVKNTIVINMKKTELNPNSFGIAAAAVAFIASVLSFGFAYPGMMGMMYGVYPGMMYGTFALVGLIAAVVVAYLAGYVFAAIYNYFESKR